MYEKELKLSKKYVGIGHYCGDLQKKNIIKKSNANLVGATFGRPPFEENTQTTPKTCSNLTSNFSLLTSDPRGITLIALIITIIVMLILVGVTINIAINGGLFTNAKQATTQTQYEADKEILQSAVIGAINYNAEVNFEKLDANLPEGFTGSEGTYTSKSGNTFCVDLYGNLIIPQVVIEGKTVELTPYNVGKYLGKVVTNFKKDYNTTTIETIRIDETDYKVSTKYRLYYVDFENKYKDGAGTIYLKADVPEDENYEGYRVPTTEITPENPTTESTEVIKIKKLNPELYKEKDEEGNTLTPPRASNDNMKAVTWLTDTSKWKSLKSNLTDEIKAEDINYIVGAPSLEIMMDSYNIYYGLKGDKPYTGELDEKSDRVKLFYKYPMGGNKYGYGVGPSNEENAKGGFSTLTSNYSVKSANYDETNIDCMYCPGYKRVYWLASPSESLASNLMSVSGNNGGFVDYHAGDKAFCPLVSLKSTVKLNLE